MLKKILPAVTGAIGFSFFGPAGAAIGAGLGSAARGDNPANIATNALMGFGLGSIAPSFGLVGGAGPGQFVTSAKTALGFGKTPAVVQQGQGMGAAAEALTKATPKTSMKVAEKTLGQKALEFAKANKLATGALGLGALGAMGAFKEEEEGTKMPPPPEPGSQGMLDITPGDVTYYDPRTRAYGAASPQIPEIYRAKDGGDIKNFPRKTGGS